jgi:copper(I)-binding protein
MRRRALLIALPCVLAETAFAQGKPAVVAENAWSRPALARIGTAVAYLSFRNEGGQPVRILGGTTPVAGRVEIHESVVENGVARMRPRPEGVAVPSGGVIRFEPNGLHLMLMKPHADLKAGQLFTLTLNLEDGGTVAVPVQVTMREPVAGHGGASH